MKNKITRTFDGKLDNFTSKQESNFHKKMLRAYLRGDTQFQDGRDNFRNPVMFKVQQTYKEI